MSHAGYDVPYRGEHVAGNTHQVVLSLVKKIAEKRCPELSDFGYLKNTTTNAHNVEMRAMNSTICWN